MDQDYVAALVNQLLNESEAMDDDFNAWLNQSVAKWHELGRDEQWIRIRFELAQSSRKLNRLMKARGLSLEQRRELLLASFTDPPLFPDQSAPEPEVTVERFQAAIETLGKDIGEIAFEMYPTINRGILMQSVQIALQQTLGVPPEKQAVHATETLFVIALREFKRLGGTYTGIKYPYRWRTRPIHRTRTTRRVRNGPE